MLVKVSLPKHASLWFMKSPDRNLPFEKIPSGSQNRTPPELLQLAEYPGIGKVILVSPGGTQEIFGHAQKSSVEDHPSRITPWGLRRRLGLVEEYQ